MAANLKDKDTAVVTRRSVTWGRLIGHKAAGGLSNSWGTSGSPCCIQSNTRYLEQIHRDWVRYLRDTSCSGHLVQRDILLGKKGEWMNKKKEGRKEG